MGHPDRTIPVAHLDESTTSLRFEPSALPLRVLYELFTTVALFPYNTALPRDEVVQLDEASLTFASATAMTVRHAAALVARFNDKVAEFRATDPHFESALIATAEARAARGY